MSVLNVKNDFNGITYKFVCKEDLQEDWDAAIIFGKMIGNIRINVSVHIKCTSIYIVKNKKINEPTIIFAAEFYKDDDGYLEEIKVLKQYDVTGVRVYDYDLKGSIKKLSQFLSTYQF